MTIAAFHQLTIDGADFVVRVSKASTKAALHQPEIVVASGEAVTDTGAPATIDPEALLGARAELDLGGRRFVGVVASIELHGMAEATFELSHPIEALGLTCDHRVLLAQDAVTITEALLGEHGLSLERRLEGTPAPRPQRVQAFESDLAFVARLLAEEGICWLVEREAPDTVVLCDHPAGFAPIEGDDTLVHGSGDGLLHAEAVTAARLEHRLRPGKATLNDWWFENPALDLTSDASVGNDALERYAYVGPERYTDPGAGKAHAARWLDMLRRDAIVLTGRSTSPRLAVGRTFVLSGAPRDDMNGRWLVTALESVSDEHGGESRFEARFVAVPADTSWRPHIEPSPTLGVQTATITGSAGEEIHTEAFGRVTALHRFDRRRDADQNSSAWMRPIHPPLSGGFMLPRVGWEALVAYGGTSGDVPFVLGRLDNGAAPTAEALPGNKRRGNFGTPTTPGRGAPNMVRMDDAAGSEQVTIAASHNFDEQTAANKATSVKATEVRIIGAKQDIVLETNHSIKVDAAQNITVGSNRSIAGNGGMLIDAGSESVTVGAMRELTIGGHLTSKIGGALTRAVAGAKVVLPLAGNSRFVNGSSMVGVAGMWLDLGAASSISVGGGSLLTSSAAMYAVGKFSIECSGLNESGGARTESATNIAVTGKTVTLNYGVTTINAPTTCIKASSNITINAGGAKIEVTPSSVTFTGAVNGDGFGLVSGNATHG